MRELGSACPMDPEASVLLHCAPWKGLREEQVRAELSTRYNRKRVAEVEEQIEEVWTERVTQEPWLFNGAKFRLFSATLAAHVSCGSNAETPHPCPRAHGRGEHGTPAEGPDTAGQKAEGRNGAPRVGGIGSTSEGDDEASERREAKDRATERPQMGAGSPEQQTVAAGNSRTAPATCCHTRKDGGGAPLTLRLGLTCYKDFLGTNWSRGVGALLARGAAEFGDPQALLAQPLGVGGVLRTTDGLIVLLRRSQKVAEAPGLLDIPGGHPEPKAVCQGVSEDSIQMEQLAERDVVRELFSSVTAEIRDEVNIPLSSLSEPVLLGIALNHTSAGRPSAEFYVSCSLSSEEVKKFYWLGGPEAHESTNIVFLSQEEVMQLDESAPLWKELCPSAKGAVMLYRLVLPDKDQ